MKRTANLNKLKELVFIILPEFLEFIKKVSNKTAVYLLKNNKSKEKILDIGFETLEE